MIEIKFTHMKQEEINAGQKKWVAQWSQPTKQQQELCSSHLLLLFFLSHSVMSNSLWPHGLQHARPLCPLPSPRACSNSCPLSRWCHPTISSSVTLFSSCLQSFPALGSFPMIRLFAAEYWPKYWSFSFSINPSNEYSGLISFRIDSFDFLAVRGSLKSLFQHYSSKASVLWCSAFFMFQHSHPYMTTGKTIALTLWTFVGKMMPLLFNTLSLYSILFQEGSIFNFMAAVTIHSDFGTLEKKVSLCFHHFPVLFAMK